MANNGGMEGQIERSKVVTETGIITPAKRLKSTSIKNKMYRRKADRKFEN